jgi:carbon-monoxide dehydrogenase medium subunit
MVPTSFEYHRPGTIDEALGLLSRHGEDAKVLAGGHSLVPAMKLRLAQPPVLIDIGRIADLSYIRERGNVIAIGAMTTHYQVESSELLRSRCPLMSELAPQIGDVQVRNKGTIGGSIVHADPAADWPAAILALDAELELAGAAGRRIVKAQDFFVDMFQTAVAANEVLCEIRVPTTGKSIAYVKTAQKASGFAIAGVAVVVDRGRKAVRVGITGVAPKAYRAVEVERELDGTPLTDSTIALASEHAADDVEPLNDIHASSEFRAHLAKLNTKRALEAAMEAAG